MLHQIGKRRRSRDRPELPFGRGVSGLAMSAVQRVGAVWRVGAGSAAAVAQTAVTWSAADSAVPVEPGQYGDAPSFSRENHKTIPEAQYLLATETVPEGEA